MPESIPGGEPLPLGPVQMWSIGFVGNTFKGEILPELERLKRLGIIRIIDMLVVRKDTMGGIAVLTASDLDWEEATAFGSYLGGLVGYGAGGLQGAQRGAMQGAAEMADGHIFDEQDTFLLEQTLANGMSAALVLIEHRWALPLREAIERAGGIELTNDWIDPKDLVEVGLDAAELGEGGKTEGEKA